MNTQELEYMQDDYEYESEDTPKREAAKRRLMGYQTFCAIRSSMLNLAQDADDRLTSTTAQMSEMVSTSGGGDKIGSGITALEAVTKQLQDTDGRLEEKLKTTVDLIERVTEINPIAGKVLTKRYLNPTERVPTYSAIAKEMGYSLDRIKHIHGEALDIVVDLIKLDTL